MANVFPATITGGINSIQLTNKLGRQSGATVACGNASVQVVRVPKGQTYPRG